MTDVVVVVVVVVIAIVPIVVVVVAVVVVYSVIVSHISLQRILLPFSSCNTCISFLSCVFQNLSRQVVCKWGGAVINKSPEYRTQSAAPIALFGVFR